MKAKWHGVLAFLAFLALIACERERRELHTPPSAAQLTRTTTISGLQPGNAVPSVEPKNPYEENAFAVSEGKRLFGWYNCSGCHANGGGGMGPALMDDKWLYGSSSANIVATILEGRPNGMPAFHSKIPDYQVWQIAAYIESLGGHIRMDVASGRSDSMALGEPESMRDEEARNGQEPNPQ